MLQTDPTQCNKQALFAFRVDSSLTIGTGHVERCLTLANALRKQGAQCKFICRDHFGNITKKIQLEGHSLTLLPLKSNSPKTSGASGYASWLGANIIDDAVDTANYLKSTQPSWLIVDHYAIDEHWECRIKNTPGIKIMVIDGQAIRKHSCDLLLDPTFSTEPLERWKGLVPQDCKMFVGLHHALLRPEFTEARSTMHRKAGGVRRIFIGFGGVDKPNTSATALDAIISLDKNDIHTDIVVGAANIHIKELQKKCREFKDVTLHIEATNIANLMSAADFAIGGGGGMLLERCYLGLPSITVSIAQNQTELCKAMDRLGASIHLGNADQVGPCEIKSVINTLMNDRSLLMKMRTKSKDLMKPSGSSLINALLGNKNEII